MKTLTLTISILALIAGLLVGELAGVMVNPPPRLTMALELQPPAPLTQNELRAMIRRMIEKDGYCVVDRGPGTDQIPPRCYPPTNPD